MTPAKKVDARKHTVQKFSAEAAKRLKPGEHIVFAPHPGLRLEASATRKTWTYRYRQVGTGALRQVRLGHWPGLPWQEVLLAWAKASAERAAGTDPGAKAKAVKQEREKAAVTAQEAARQTLGWLVSEYLAAMVDGVRKDKGAREARRMLTRAIAPYHGLPAKDITPQVAGQLIRSIGKAKRIASMVRQELRAAFRYGIDNGLVDANPFAGRHVGGKLENKARDRALSEEEVAALLRWWQSPRTHSRSVRDALMLTLYTGMRSGEVVALHERELHERDGVLWADIPASRMKSEKEHRVPLVGTARTIVEARRGGAGGWLFPSGEGKAHLLQKALGVEVYACSGRSSHKVYQHRPKCPVMSWAPHDLRRTARTLLGKIGCPPVVGERILAHTLPAIMAVYDVGDYLPERVEWLTKLGAHLDGLRDKSA